MITLNKCELIIIDLKKDKKGMNILDLKDQNTELIEFIHKYGCKYIAKGKLKLAFL